MKKETARRSVEESRSVTGRARARKSRAKKDVELIRRALRTGILRDEHSRGGLERIGAQIVERGEAQPVTIQVPADHARRHVVLAVRLHYHQLAAVPATKMPR